MSLLIGICTGCDHQKIDKEVQETTSVINTSEPEEKEIGYSGYRCGTENFYYDINWKKNEPYLVQVDLEGKIVQRNKVKVPEGEVDAVELSHADKSGIYLQIERCEYIEDGWIDYSCVYRIPFTDGEESDLTKTELLFEQKSDMFDTDPLFLYIGQEYLVYYQYEYGKSFIRYDYADQKKIVMENEYVQREMYKLNPSASANSNHFTLFVDDVDKESDCYMIYDAQREKFIYPDIHGAIERTYAYRGPTFYHLWTYDETFLYQKRKERDVRFYDVESETGGMFLTNLQVKELLKKENQYHEGLTWEIRDLDVRDERLYLQLDLSWKEKKIVHNARVVISCLTDERADFVYEKELSEVLREKAKEVEFNFKNNDGFNNRFVEETGSIDTWGERYLELYYEKHKDYKGEAIFIFYDMKTKQFLPQTINLDEEEEYKYLVTPKMDSETVE